MAPYRGPNYKSPTDLTGFRNLVGLGYQTVYKTARTKATTPFYPKLSMPEIG